jgi:vacuolar-type H+-ATPase subunit E/Vma4
MGLSEVITDVRRDGEARAAAIVAAARKEANALLDGARAQAKAYEATRLADADRQAKAAAAQVASRAESDARKAVLSGEAALRAELKAATLKALKDAPAKSRQAHLTALLARAQKVIPAGKVWGAAADAATLEKAKPYAYAGTAPIAGGVLVESESGDARLDLSYETLLDDQWRSILRSEAGLFA